MKLLHKILVIIVALLLIVGGIFALINFSEDEEIGSNDIGYVTKKYFRIMVILNKR